MFERFKNILSQELSASMVEQGDFSNSSGDGDSRNFTAFGSEKRKRFWDTHLGNITNALET